MLLQLINVWTALLDFLMLKFHYFPWNSISHFSMSQLSYTKRNGIFIPLYFQRFLNENLIILLFQIPKPCQLQRRMSLFCFFLKKTGTQVDVVACGPSIKFTPLILLSPYCFSWAFLELPWARFGTCCHKGFRGPENQSTTFNPLKSHRINRISSFICKLRE